MLLLPVSAVLGLLLGCGVALLGGERLPSPGARPGSGAGQAAPHDQDRAGSSAGLSRPAAGAGISTRLAATCLPARTRRWSHAVQQTLRQILAALPKHDRPYVLAISALGDPELAAAGARLVAIGLGRIGGKVLLVKEADPATFAGDYNFILASMPQHDLGPNRRPRRAGADRRRKPPAVGRRSSA